MDIILIILAVAVGFIIGRRNRPQTSLAEPKHQAEAHQASREALSERTEERKDKIIEMMHNAREHYEELKACKLVEERKGIKREDVEELLDVSKKTALLYLDELEEEGKIKQMGFNRNTYYVLKTPRPE